MSAPNIQLSNNPAVLNGGVFGNVIDGRTSTIGTQILGTVTVNGSPISTEILVVNGVLSLPSTVSGTATLSNGSVLVPNTDTALTSEVIVTIQGAPTPQPNGERAFYVTNKIPGVSFVIQSTKPNDNSTVAWLKIG